MKQKELTILKKGKELKKDQKHLPGCTDKDCDGDCKMEKKKNYNKR